MAESAAICRECRYWVTLDDEAIVGECHRYSPERDPRAPRSPTWPWVNAEEWCGEHETDEKGVGHPRRKPGT